jgi:hypothetical protein
MNPQGMAPELLHTRAAMKNTEAQHPITISGVFQ